MRSFFSSDTFAFMLFVSFCCGVFYMHLKSEVEIALCPDNEGGYLFVGERRDFEKIAETLVEYRKIECEEKTLTRGEWSDLRLRLRHTFPHLKKAGR